LKKLADEMQDLISEMKSKGVRPETMQKQERILSRLLQAERSIHERDKDETREAKRASDIKGNAPADLDPNSEEAKRAIREDMMNNKDGVYSKDYQALIRKYLEKLGK
jgi:TolA-binding protein